MEKRLHNPSAEVVLSCLEEKYLKNEVMLDEHCFVRIISGEVKIVLAATSQVYGPGDTILFPRRQLSTVIQYPKDNKAYKCVLIILKGNRLKEYYSRNRAYASTERIPAVKSYKKHPLVESYFASLLPYFELQEALPEKLLALKIEEAITILRTIDKSVDTFLADFSEPGKIDLAEFMEKNYMFNMSLEKFSYLTGRSLTTFKRDFTKIYGITPQRWLINKRLQLAHYLLSESKQKPVEVYREAGFENLSHFSYAFKKLFGYAPKEII
ncbi:AraC family transcriptional regulator [Hymenobacter sp. YC55]|uniref:helix-turn-helix domain-containing protein n=1 Tax=Hymenobacter sp. YC55 TaxID=3034019 RepID=UPI0023FA2B23|nr:AraC family transcriptional regulator [Hymenobacter sp. YC55]MDF7814232.1 AraC family transcriptional regulator [Hymenobacter sp. YC55]